VNLKETVIEKMFNVLEHLICPNTKCKPVLFINCWGFQTKFHGDLEAHRTYYFLYLRPHDIFFNNGIHFENFVKNTKRRNESHVMSVCATGRKVAASRPDEAN
jgi:hypothetical protein